MSTTTALEAPQSSDLTRPVDAELVAKAHELRERAEHLRNQALSFSDADLLATTFRRRASELELEAWASEVRSGLPLDAITAAVA